ncbi:MAG: hypothetical protein M1370_11455 [Bacteroidetes bacterium]|nr:hypothetical protein [Bacteroidota bacterium]
MSLLDFVRYYKSRSTRLAWQYDHNGDLWQARYYDHFLRKDEDILVVVDYIVNNPVRKGIAVQSSEYPYCGSFVYELWPQSAG